MLYLSHNIIILCIFVWKLQNTNDPGNVSEPDQKKQKIWAHNFKKHKFMFDEQTQKDKL